MNRFGDFRAAFLTEISESKVDSNLMSQKFCV